MRLGGIQKSPHYPTSSFLQKLEVSLNQNLTELFYAEHEFWKLKSRIHWLNEGDANTKFYHMSTVHKRRKNKIFAFRDTVGNWIVDRHDLEDHVTSFFSNLYSTDLSCSNKHFYQASNHFISVEDTDHLERPSVIRKLLTRFSLLSPTSPQVRMVSSLSFSKNIGAL